VTPLLAVEELQIVFPTSHGPLSAVNRVSFTLAAGRTLNLVGESGSGKSVIARALMGLLLDGCRISGKIRFEGRDLLRLTEKQRTALRGDRIAIILQNPDLALNPVLRVGRQMTDALAARHRLGAQKARAEAVAALSRMGFENPADIFALYPFQLSSGMKQRVIFANALLSKPRLIIADEPSKGLDRNLRDRIASELRLAREANRSALLIITHDLPLARRMGGRVAVMVAGRLVEIRDSESFFKNPGHPYSQALINSLPGNGFEPMPEIRRQGADNGQGCPFYSRCPVAEDICGERNPDLLPVEQGKVACVKYS
jgi:peptide/nickel transport system ATP-binding protein